MFCGQRQKKRCQSNARLLRDSRTLYAHSGDDRDRAGLGWVAGDTGDVERLVNLPIWGMVGVDDKKDRTTG